MYYRDLSQASSRASKLARELGNSEKNVAIKAPFSVIYKRVQSEALKRFKVN
jgi:hypothetical protein